jgi:diguanylate cyclase (GGDEF)-like protein/PAS domain S-box-containing protein
MGALIRARDWSTTSLGRPETWPHALKTALSILLNSKHQMFMAWGPDLISFYNDAYRPVLGARHPDALGRPFPEVWADVWPAIGPLVNQALAGEGTWSENLPLVTFRNGFQEIAYFTFSYSPIFDESGTVEGMFCACTETTDKVLAESPSRKRVNSLRATEGWMYSLFQQAPGFMAVVRGPDHVFEVANAAHQQLVGFRSIIGKPVREALPEIANQGFAQLLDRVYTTGRPHIGRSTPLLVQSARGAPSTLRYIDFIFQPIAASDGSVSGIFIQGHDVTDHKQAEVALADREERYRALIEASAVVVWFAAPTGEITHSQGWSEFIGQDESRFTGTGWMRMVHPDDQERVASVWQQALSSAGVYQAEFRVLHNSGEYRWMYASAVPIRNPDDSVREWVGCAWDVHERKQAIEELRASEERLQLALQAGRMAAWEADLTTNYVIRSQNSVELLGVKSGPAADILPRVHPDDLAKVKAFTRLLDEAEATVEFRFTAPDGKTLWLGARAKKTGPDRAVGVVFDITDRKAAEEQLQASEERLRLAMETTALGIWDVDLRSDHREWTPEAKAILGIPADAPVTRDSFLERVHPEDRATVEASFFSAASPGPLSYSGTYRIIRADAGGERWVTATGRTLLDCDGHPIRKIGTVQDITAIKRSETALRANEERLRLALQAARMIAWEQDLATNVVTRSENAVGLLGIGSGPLSQMLDRIHPEDRHLREHFRPGGGAKGSDSIEFRYTTPNGQKLWLGLRGEWAGPNRLIGVTFDITAQKEAEAEIWRVANHDALTGLPNRALFQQRLEQALDAARRNGTSVSLLMLDFDHFKEVNDALGHAAGDAFLQEMARRLKALTRDCDTVARLSGDEFAVLVVEPLRLEHASRLAGIMVAKLSEPFQYLGRSLSIKASIGIAAYPDHDATPAELLKDADIALFEAKQERNRVVTYRPILRSVVEQRISLLEEVTDALPKRQIVPFYQPKVCLGTGRIVGLEVLARWRHPKRGILSPDCFGAAFEEPRLALALSQSLLTQVASDLRHWLDAGFDPGRVAFNLSACEFSQPDFANHVFGILDAAHIPPEHVEMEVTEMVLLSRHAERISATLNSFHARGITIALDDFGTGYASLTHLKQFPVSHIKIDRSFVMNLEKDTGDEAIVAAIIALGRNLGMRITAEGVETTGQAKRLRDLGCHDAQGYLFAKPVESAEIPQLLSKFGTKDAV